MALAFSCNRAGVGWGEGCPGMEELWVLPSLGQGKCCSKAGPSPLPRLVSTHGETLRGWAETQPPGCCAQSVPTPGLEGCGTWSRGQSRGGNRALGSCYRPEQNRGGKGQETPSV